MPNSTARRRPGHWSFRWERDYPGLTDRALYAVAADIKNYPEFVPGCIATHVTKCEPGCLQVDNLFGFGPVRARFRSTAQFEPPQSIKIESTDGPWRQFLLTWHFESRVAGCRVTCICDCELRSSLLARMAVVALPTVEAMIIAAFERKARGLSPSRLRGG